MAQSIGAKFKYVMINDYPYIADENVCKYIDHLETELDKAKAEHQRYVDSINADVARQAERVALNLASGLNDSDNCLAHDLSYFEKTTNTGDPIFAFRKEVLTRIMLALTGKDVRGNKYTR